MCVCVCVCVCVGGGRAPRSAFPDLDECCWVDGTPLRLLLVLRQAAAALIQFLYSRNRQQHHLTEREQKREREKEINPTAEMPAQPAPERRPTSKCSFGDQLMGPAHTTSPRDHPTFTGGGRWQARSRRQSHLGRVGGAGAGTVRGLGDRLGGAQVEGAGPGEAQRLVWREALCPAELQVEEVFGERQVGVPPQHLQTVTRRAGEGGGPRGRDEDRRTATLEPTDLRTAHVRMLTLDGSL